MDEEKALTKDTPDLGKDLESERPTHATPTQGISIGQLKAKYATPAGK